MTTIRHFILLTLLFLSFSNPSFSEEKKPSVSSSTYHSLEKIQKLMTANKNRQAISDLKTLYAKVKQGSDDQAVVAQTLGYAELSVSDYTSAIKHFKKSLNMNVMGEKTDNNMRYMLAQLLASKEKYKEAIGYASVWYKSAKKIKPSQNIFMASLYAQSKQYKQASVYASKAIASSKSPKESWYQLLVSCYYQAKQYGSAAGAMKQMVARWPNKKNYWEQLAGIYLNQNKVGDALAVLDIAWRNGILNKESSIKALVQYTFVYGIPERGARILQKAINEKKVAANKTTLKVLAGAWVRAKETDKAIAAYQRLIKVTNDSKDRMMLAHLYIQKEHWKSAEKTLQTTVKRGGSRKSEALLLLGIAYMKDGELEKAKESLSQAVNYDKTKSQASAWLNYVQQKIQSEADMAKREDPNGKT